MTEIVADEATSPVAFDFDEVVPHLGDPSMKDSRSSTGTPALGSITPRSVETGGVWLSP